MTGPKHLWSGDWERESARAAEQRAAQPLTELPSPPASVDDELPSAPRRWGRKQLRIAVGSGIAAAAVTALLVLALAGGPNKAAAHNAASSRSGPTANWLGMEIVTSPGGVVISTVTLNSPADAVGLNPGDEITAVDGHPITSIDQIRSDTAGLRLGSQVTIQVQRASVMVQFASLPMTERPTIHP